MIIDTTNHSFDIDDKYDFIFLMAYNISGFLTLVKMILGEDYNPAIEDACNRIKVELVDGYLDRMVRIKK